jgi:hypothetical protein
LTFRARTPPPDRKSGGIAELDSLSI